MKKVTLITLILIMTASLAACSTSASTGSRKNAAGSSTAEGTTGLSTLNKMAVGIFKLEGSANDLTADQDKEMLVLWEAYKQVSTSDTSSPQEKQALIAQIQSTLTAEQNSAIEAMNLTAMDVRDLMQQRGIEAAASSTQTSSSSSSSTSNRSSGGSGGFPGGGGGGFPGGGGGGFPGGGAGMAPDAAGGAASSGTPQAGGARTGGPAGANGGGFVSESMTKAIIDALITMLQQKVA